MGAPQPVKELEAAVSLCASMAYTIHKDCLIDLLLVGTDLHSFTSLPRATRLDRVHETLAAVEPSADYTFEQVGTLWEDRLEEISEVIFVVLRWDGTYQRLAQMAEQAGCHCTVMVVGEPDASDWMADFSFRIERGDGRSSAIRNPNPGGDVRLCGPTRFWRAGGTPYDHQRLIAVVMI
jgi:hypothetical protein